MNGEARSPVLSSAPDCHTAAFCQGTIPFGLCWPKRSNCSQKFNQACCHWVAHLEVCRETWPQKEPPGLGSINTGSAAALPDCFLFGAVYKTRKSVAFQRVWISLWKSFCCDYTKLTRVPSSPL